MSDQRRRSSRPPSSVSRSKTVVAASAVTYVAREISATLRVGLSAPRGWRDARAAAPAHRDGDDVVILVHGLLASAGAFSPIVRHLRQALDVDVRTFSFLPGAGLGRIADHIAEAVSAHREARRIHLVGHSLGGLAVRHYVQRGGADSRITQTISIASPFLAIELAEAFPDPLRKLLFPLQPEIDAIVRGAPEHLARVPHLSILAERDQIVTPVHAAILPGTPHFVLHDTGHNGALFHPKLFDAVVDAIHRRAREVEFAQGLRASA